MTKAPTWQSTLWHMPGRIWAGMMAAPLPNARFWVQTGAGMAMTLLMIGYGLVIWLGPWPEALASQRLELLGYGHLAAAFLVLVTLVAITGMKLGLDASRAGLKAAFERDDDDAPVAPKVVTTTTTEVTPVTAAPAKPDPAVNNEPMP